MTRWCSDIQKDSGEIYSDNTFKKHAENHNKYRRLVDKLIMDNFDVDILPFDYTTLISEKYPWGCLPYHFNYSFLKEKTEQINKIALRHMYLNTNINHQIRNLNKKRFLLYENNFLNYSEIKNKDFLYKKYCLNRKFMEINDSLNEILETIHFEQGDPFFMIPE